MEGFNMRSFLEITGSVLQILQQWFQVNVEEKFRWDTDPLKTKIEIAPSFLWSPEVTQVRPGIYVKRDGWAARGMGTRTGFNDNLSYSRTGEDTYAYMPAAQISVMVIGKHAGEAEELSNSVTYCLLALAPVIRNEFNLLAFDLEAVSGIQKTEEYKEMWVIQHQCQYKYVLAIDLTELSPVIKRITVDAFSRLYQNPEAT
jgi:hypothetical protein